MTLCTVALSDPLQKALAIVGDEQRLDKPSTTPLQGGQEKGLGNYILRGLMSKSFWNAALIT